MNNGISGCSTGSPSDFNASTFNNGLAPANRTVCVAAWAPIIGGAFAAVSLSLVLALLGAGLGFAVTSPWQGAGASAATLTIEAIVWLVVVQWLASGVAGYLAGRLRAPWQGIHTHEVFFRDTAHGFLSWSLATVFTVVALASLVPSMTLVTHGPERGAPSEKHLVMDASSSLLRTSHPGVTPVADGPETREETARILMTAVASKDPLSADDKTYLDQVVAAREGISTDEADKRVDATVNNLRQSVDKARKGAATLSIFMALAMMVGAFVASAAAALGGMHRDDYQVKQ